MIMEKQIVPTSTVRAYDRRHGESMALMEHAEELKSLGRDTSVDSAFEVDDSLSGADSYVAYTFKGWLAIKLLIFAVPMLFLQFPSVAISRLYISCLPYGTKTLNRSGVVFNIVLLLSLIFCLPVLLLVLISYAMDCWFYYTFSVLYCVLFCKWPTKYAASQKAIDPYRHGPHLLFNIVDCFVAMIGQGHRQGLFEMTCLLVGMWLFVPTLKYYVNANPIIYNLDERYVQQITTSMADMPVVTVCQTARAIISDAKQPNAEATKRIDEWAFIPHYPYPPGHKEWAVGMQVTSMFSLFVHVTHADFVAERSRGEKSMYILSNSVERPIYRVMLWYNNPFHLLTGFVEASASNGESSQLDKKGGGEHPMWLVTSHSRGLNDRFKGLSGPGVIDNFFDTWLPTFVHEVRRRVRGLEIADEMREEVISKDGISRPAGREEVKPAAATTVSEP